jgi:hypothetical protein
VSGSFARYFATAALCQLIFVGVTLAVGKKENDLKDAATTTSSLRVFKDEATGLLGYKNGDGMFAISPSYKNAEAFTGSLAFIENQDGSVGLIDQKGRIVTPNVERAIWVSEPTLTAAGVSEGLLAARDIESNRVGFGWLRRGSPMHLSFMKDSRRCDALPTGKSDLSTRKGNSLCLTSSGLIFASHQYSRKDWRLLDLTIIGRAQILTQADSLVTSIRKGVGSSRQNTHPAKISSAEGLAFSLVIANLSSRDTKSSFLEQRGTNLF